MQPQLLSDIKAVLDITSRVDERVKLIQANQQEFNGRLNQIVGEFNQLNSRVTVLESKNGGKLHALEDDIDKINTRVEKLDVTGTVVIQKAIEKIQEKAEEIEEEIEEKVNGIVLRLQKIENLNEGWQAKLKTYGGLVIQGIWVVIICFILLRLGLTSAPLP